MSAMWLIFFSIVLTASIAVALLLDLLRWGLRTHPSITAFLLAVVIPTALICHAFGYKLYGSPTVIDNRPILTNPRSIRSFAAPNIVVAADGARFEVKGATFSDDLLNMRGGDLAPYLYQDSGDIWIEADPDSPSGVVFQKKNRYSCGCTFWPTWLPGRLPKYERKDFGNTLKIRSLLLNQPETPDEINHPLK